MKFRNSKYIERFDGTRFRSICSSGTKCVDTVCALLPDLLPQITTVLEAGAGYGEYLYALNANNIKFDAVEIDSDAFASLPVFSGNGYFNESIFDFQGTNYDAVLCNPPFRHISFENYVLVCLSKLKIDGILVLHRPLLWNSKKHNKLKDILSQTCDFMFELSFYSGDQRVLLYKKRELYVL